MTTLFRRNNFMSMRTLYTKSNDNVYEIDNVIIMKNGKEWITKGAYEVFDGGIDLGIDVVRRLKADTGLKNKDKAFIVKAEKQSVWNDDTVYDMYIDNDLLEFKEVKKELYNVQTTIGTETTYKSDKLELEFMVFECHASETMDKLQNVIVKFNEIEKGYISYLSTLNEVETYTTGLLSAKKEIDALIEKAKKEVLSTL